MLNSTPSRIALRVALAWGLIVTALLLATQIGGLLGGALDSISPQRALAQAFVMSAVVVPGIWWLRTRLDQRSMDGLGLGNAASGFGFGVAIVAIPVLVVIALSEAFGWADVVLTLTPSVLVAVLVSVLSVFFYEALPEELVFRGYIYRTLTLRLPRWAASLLTIVLFAALIPVLFWVQQALFGQEVRINGGRGVTGGFLVTLLVFASFHQYLRVLTGTVWANIGFHFALVLFNRVVSSIPRPGFLVHFADVTGGSALQAVTFGMIGVTLIALLAYPWISKRPLGWREHDPDAADPDPPVLASSVRTAANS